MRIRITTQHAVLYAMLEDNPTSKDFWSMLPLTLRLDDYASTEKVSTLARKLRTDRAPAGITPVKGDVTYYAPWGNLALFYRNFEYSEGLIRLGCIEGDLKGLTQSTSFAVTVERM